MISADLRKNEIIRVLYLCPDVTDMKLFARVMALKEAKTEVITMGFHRKRYDAGKTPDWRHIDIGLTKDRAYLKRLGVILRIILLIPELRRFFTNSSGRKIVIARNLDMGLLACMVRALLGVKTVFVYEVLDIQRIMVGGGWKSRTARWLERLCLKQCDRLIVSSPYFVTEYFHKFQWYTGDWRLVENKIVKPLPFIPGEPETRPWVIGWLGTLRCKRSLGIICKLANRLGNKVRFDLYGYPARIGEADFVEAISHYENIYYHGSYSHDQLPDIMKSIHFSWCFDYSDDWGNSIWLLPNRLYEAGCYGRPLLADKDHATGGRTNLDGLGWTFRGKHLVDDITNFIEHLDPVEWRATVARIQSKPPTDFIEAGDFCRAAFN